jgi:hypothetical protein
LIDRIAAEVHPRDTFILFAAAHGKSEAGRLAAVGQATHGNGRTADTAQLGRNPLILHVRHQLAELNGGIAVAVAVLERI